MTKVVHLRIFKGTEILRKEDGTIKNENQIVKLLYETMEWNNYMTRLPYSGNCKVEVLKVLEAPDYKELDKSAINDEVQKAWLNKPQVVLTEQEKTILELKAKIDLLIKNAAIQELKRIEVEDCEVDDYVAPLTYDSEKVVPQSPIKTDFQKPIEEIIEKTKIKPRKAKRVNKK